MVGGNTILTEQIKREKIERALNYMLQKRRNIFSNITEEQNKNYKSEYLRELDDRMKSNLKDLSSMCGWLLNNLNVTPPNAFTDDEVDSIDKSIRTIEERIGGME